MNDYFWLSRFKNLGVNKFFTSVTDQLKKFLFNIVNADHNQ